MTTITISDVGHTLVVMDMELDKLDAERVELEMKLEHNNAKAAIIRQAMKQLLKDARYDLGDI